MPENSLNRTLAHDGGDDFHLSAAMVATFRVDIEDAAKEPGNPSPRKLHKASKAADEVRVYTYKDPALLLKDIAAEKIHKAEALKIFSFDPRFLERLVSTLQKDNEWNLVCSDSSLVLSLAKDRVEQSEVKHHPVKPE